MRTYLRGKITLLFMMLGLLLAVPAIALADVVQNNIDTSIDATAETRSITTDGSTVVGYTLQTANNNTTYPDSNGCNTMGGNTVNVSIVTPAGVTASPSSLAFTGCGTTQNVTFTSSKATPAGSPYNITVTASGGAAGTTTYTDPATWTLTVNKAQPTISAVSGTGNAGASNGSLTATLKNATVTPNKNLSGKDVTFKIDGNNVSGTAQTDANGVATLNDVDLSGVTQGTKSLTAHFAGDADYLLADGSGNLVVGAPLCTTPADPTFSGTPNGSDGWYKTTIPTVSASSTAGATVQYSLNAAGPFSNTAPTLGQGQTTVYAKAVSGTCSSGVSSQLYKVDTIAPQINDDGTTQTPNGAGWFNTAVTNNFSASDATSGLASAANFTKSSGTDEGSAVKINSGTVSDNAGNTNPGIDSAAFKIDMTNPVANCDSAPTSWSATDVSIRCQPTDALSGLANTADGDFNLSTTVAANTETSNASTNSRSVADAAGNSVTAGPITGLKVDKKAPVLTDEGPTTTPNGDNGWYKSAVTNGFKATDGGSGFAPSGNLTDSFTKSSGTNEGAAVKIASGAVSDAVGNSTLSIDSAAFKIDLSDPSTPTFNDGPAAGSSHYFGSVPAEPTCSSSDAVSGLKDCKVNGYSTAVGTHTMTATATDNAGRTATETRSYTVLAWTTKGFYQPVDMTPANSPTVYNTVKGGSTVPLKFELFAGDTELTDTSKVTSLQATKVTCTSGATIDDIETVATGGTSLRYDSTGGQFIYNWKTPTGANTCHKVTVTANDGSTITAFFKMK